MAIDAGSRMHVLDCVEGRGPDFVRSLSGLLEPSGASVGPSDHWCPRGHDVPDEIKLGRPCEPFLSNDRSRQLRAWWLAVDHPGANEPNWDLIATAQFPGGRPGLVIVEAKAHVAELLDGARGKSPGNADNDKSIGRAIAEARDALGGPAAGVNVSRDTHYQFSNRVAFAWKIAALGIPTVLVYLGFIGDDGMDGEPLRDAEHWRATVLGHTRGIWPATSWDRQIMVNGAPLWTMIRAMPCCRPSPPPGAFTPAKLRALSIRS